MTYDGCGEMEQDGCNIAQTENDGKFKDMKTSTALATLLGAASLVLPGQSALATVVTLDFSGNICSPFTDEPCTDGKRIGADYGDNPPVFVDYSGYQAEGNSQSSPFLSWWGTGYGDLVGVAREGNGNNGAIRVIAQSTSTFQVRLISFDIACFDNRPECQTISYGLGQAIPSTPLSFSVTPPSGGHATVNVNGAFTSDPVGLVWSPHAGVDNFVFEFRNTAAVPEPGTWALLILGFGAIGGAIRRRKDQTPIRAVSNTNHQAAS